MTLKELTDALGLKVIAYVCSFKDTNRVIDWIEGINVPTGFQLYNKIILLEEMYKIITSVYDTQTFISWAHGMNPQLNDVAPFRLLRETENVYDVKDELITAAKYFAEIE